MLAPVSPHWSLAIGQVQKCAGEQCLFSLSSWWEPARNTRLEIHRTAGPTKHFDYRCDVFDKRTQPMPAGDKSSNNNLIHPCLPFLRHLCSLCLAQSCSVAFVLFVYCHSPLFVLSHLCSSQRRNALSTLDQPVSAFPQCFPTNVCWRENELDLSFNVHIHCQHSRAFFSVNVR